MNEHVNLPCFNNLYNSNYQNKYVFYIKNFKLNA